MRSVTGNSPPTCRLKPAVTESGLIYQYKKKLTYFSLDDGSIERLTDVPYIYGRDFSKDGRTIGYIARYGDAEPYRNCLTLLDLESGESTDVLCEEGGEHRMVWTSVNFRPSGDGASIAGSDSLVRKVADRNSELFVT